MTPGGRRRRRLLNWSRSLSGKLAAFILAGCLLTYALGAATGLVILDRSLREQWLRQAEMNAQISSASIRSVYTAIVVDTDENGQVMRIISERPLGDASSVLDTGFTPSDVLAQAAAQTRKDIWLFVPSKDGSRLESVADAQTVLTGKIMSYADTRIWPAALRNLYIGFARIDGVEYCVSALPVVSPSGELMEVIVSSIGTKDELYGALHALIRSTLLTLLAMLVVAGSAVAILMRRFFRPVPALIEAVTRIARHETSVATPYRMRNDEIGDLAKAIEKLRETVIEREHLLEIKASTLRLEHMAHHDALTGLPNRAALNQVLDAACEVLGQGRHFNVLMFDLDRFKAVNDCFGHPVGDVLLSEVAERITLLLRENDFVARLGGDEFAVIQRVQGDARHEAEKLASRLVETLERPFHIHGQEITIGCSIGIARAPFDGYLPHDLMSHADTALYAAKRRSSQELPLRFYEQGMTMPSLREARVQIAGDVTGTAR